MIPLAGGAPLFAMALLIAAQLTGDGLRTVEGRSARPACARAPCRWPSFGRAAGSAFATGRGLAGVAGALIGGALGGVAGPRETLLVAAAGVALTPLVGLASPLWRERGGRASQVGA